MKQWDLDKRYSNLYFAQANNEKEYIKLIKDLYGEYEVYKSFSYDSWLEKEHLFNEDLVVWHELFKTDCLKDDKYENEDMPKPKDYKGNIGYKPSNEEYPLILIFSNLGEDKLLTWYSINEDGESED